ncbi:hypothetical protein PVAP13_4KG265125, partial [Panicum virgatum]
GPGTRSRRTRHRRGRQTTVVARPHHHTPSPQGRATTDTKRRGKGQKRPAAAPQLPEDLVVSEILTRLPVKPLLRCRAVCRSWRLRLTSDAKFLLAHHRRQPSLPLLTNWDRDTHERRIDALDHRTGERHPVGRIAASEYDVHVLAACDGLIILHAYGGLEICNPATRQRAPLTLLHGAACISALNPHRPSGSHRVLCCFERAEDGHAVAVYHMHTVGSGELRCVGELPGPWASGDLAVAASMMGFLHPPVLADGRIYWSPGKGKVNNMLVFDTMSESFQHLLSPVDGPFVELFEMNSGALGLYHRGSSSIDLWVLKDHQSWSWSLNSRIKLDVRFFSLLPVLDPGGMCSSFLPEGNQASSGNICITFLVPMAVCWHGINGALI